MGIPDDVIRRMSKTTQQESSKDDKDVRQNTRPEKIEKRQSSTKPKVRKTERKVVRKTEVNKAETDDGWVVDPVTGVRHKVLAKTEWIPGSGGRSKSTVGDDMKDPFDDMNSAAEIFLGHLRVPPDEKETQRLNEERQRRRREQEEEQRKIEALERQEDQKVDEILKKKGFR